MTQIKQVENAKVNETIQFDESFQFEHVRFTLKDYGGEKPEYCWDAKRRDDWHYLTSFGNRRNTIQTFKTLAGAKRNFLKQYSHYFREG